jgi:hypothetical protein
MGFATAEEVMFCLGQGTREVGVHGPCLVSGIQGEG